MEIYMPRRREIANGHAGATQEGEQMAIQPEPEMTPEEREQFERNKLHHEDEDVDRSSGPASEPDLRTDKPLPPDTGAVKR